MRLSAMSTGMGPDNVEIVLAEVMEITDQPSFIRIGSSGALQPEIELGDLIVSIGAVRLENTTDFYVSGLPAIAHREVVAALEAACLERGYRHHLGLTATASGRFAPWEGRCTLPVRYPQPWRRLRRQGVANLEMESSALFVLTSSRAPRRTVCAAYAQRIEERSWKERQRRLRRHVASMPGSPGIHLLWGRTRSRTEIPDVGPRDRRASGEQ